MKRTLFNLDNKNIIITGGNGFLGNQITEALLNEKANVYVIDIKQSKKKTSAKHFTSDITDENELKKILKFFKLKKIKIDVLINNAAVDYSPSKSQVNNLKLENFSNDLWDKDIAVSLKGSYLCTKVFGSYMAKFKKGIIINVSSDLGIIAPDQRIYKKSGFIKPVTYSIVKHGIIGLTKYTASYWGEKNIRCNAIAPGTVHTPSWEGRVSASNDPVQAKKDFIDRQPMGRLGTPEEIAAIAIYLASDESSFATGNTFSVDGGMTI